MHCCERNLLWTSPNMSIALPQSWLIQIALDCTWWLWTIVLLFWLCHLCLKYEVEVPTSQQLNFILATWLQKLAGSSSTVVGEIQHWKNWVHLSMHCGLCNGRKLRGHKKSQFVRVPIWFQKSYIRLNKVKNPSIFTSVTIISAVFATGTQCSWKQSRIISVISGPNSSGSHTPCSAFWTQCVGRSRRKTERCWCQWQWSPCCEWWKIKMALTHHDYCDDYIAWS